MTADLRKVKSAVFFIGTIVYINNYIIAIISAKATKMTLCQTIQFISWDIHLQE